MARLVPEPERTRCPNLCSGTVKKGYAQTGGALVIENFGEGGRGFPVAQWLEYLISVRTVVPSNPICELRIFFWVLLSPHIFLFHLLEVTRSTAIVFPENLDFCLFIHISETKADFESSRYPMSFQRKQLNSSFPRN